MMSTSSTSSATSRAGKGRGQQRHDTNKENVPPYHLQIPSFHRQTPRRSVAASSSRRPSEDDYQRPVAYLNQSGGSRSIGHQRRPQTSSRYQHEPSSDGGPIRAVTDRTPAHPRIRDRILNPTLIDTCIIRNAEYWRTRITLKVDVAYNEHSHIIGREGKNTQAVMKETGCHIHFPDINRMGDGRKSNWVTLAGPLRTIDKARQRIRRLQPIILSFPVPEFEHDLDSLRSHWILQQVQTMFEVQTSIRESSRGDQWPFLVIKGNANLPESICHAVVAVQQALNINKAVSTSLEILPPQQQWVFGDDFSTIQMIADRSETSIYYPTDRQHTTVFIQGQPSAVINARQYIIGCLPVSMSFELPEMRRFSLQHLEQLGRETNLIIYMKEKGEDEDHKVQVVVVRGQERQLPAIYEVRKRILGDNEPLPVCSDYDMLNANGIDLRGKTSGLRNDLVNEYDYYPPVVCSPLTSPCVIQLALPSYYVQTGLPAVTVNDSSPHVQVKRLSSGYSSGNSRPNSAAGRMIAPMQLAPVPPPKTNETAVKSEANAATTKKGRRDLTLPNNEDALNDSAIISYGSPLSPLDKMSNPIAASLLESARRHEANAQCRKVVGAERNLPLASYSEVVTQGYRAMGEKPANLRRPDNRYSGYGLSHSMPEIELQEVTNLINGGGIGAGSTRANNSKDSLAEKISTMRVKNATIQEEDQWSDGIGPWGPGECPSPFLPGNANGKSKKDLSQTAFFDGPLGTSTPRKSSIFSVWQDDVFKLLNCLNISQHAEVFRREDVDLDILLKLNDSDLKDLKLPLGARKKLEVAISQINQARKDKKATISFAY